MLALLRPRIAHAHRRTFVSSVLLTKSWELESAAELRREAKDRGLSTKGNKLALVTRIKDHEQRQVMMTPAPGRAASTVSISPGIPPPSQPANAPPKDFMDIRLPDISLPDMEPAVQIPFVPDFWDSKSISKPSSADPPLPKLVVIAGADTHHGGGPSHNLHDEQREVARRTDSHLVPTTTSTIIAPGGLLHDIAQDIGIPLSLDVKDTKQMREMHTVRSRKLDKDETRGFWALLGLLVGSWIIGGVVNGTPPTGGKERRGSNH